MNAISKRKKIFQITLTLRSYKYKGNTKTYFELKIFFFLQTENVDFKF